MANKPKRSKSLKGRLTRTQQGDALPRNLLLEARALQQAGRLPAAEVIYRQILQAEPYHPDALHSLGMLAHQAGKGESAVGLIRQALACRPDDVEALYNLGFVLLVQGKTAEAAETYQRLLTLKPDYVEAHNNLGNAFLAQGHLEKAAASFRRAIALKPDSLEAHNNLGLVLKDQGRLEEAVACFRKTLALKPAYLEGIINLGITLHEQGKLEEAVACHHRATDLKPDFAEAHFYLGAALREQGRLEEASASFQKVLALQPNHIEALNSLGNTLLDQGRQEEAVTAYRRILSLKPNYTEVYSNLGNALKDQGKLEEAVACHQRAIALKPDYAEAHNNLGNALKDQGKLEEAVASLQRAVFLRPAYYKAHSNLLLCLNYLSRISQQVMYGQSVEWDKLVAGMLPPGLVHANSKDPSRKLRVGYVSADFKKHSVAYFFEPLLRSHNREHVEVYCYANVKKTDETTGRLQAAADHWRSIVGSTDTKVAEWIREDRIDILVDLGGHTGENRLLVFAYKAAPIQVSWLGYPNTTGMRAMDYRFTDAIADPPGEADTLYREKLIRLEHGFLCYQPDDSAPPAGPPPCQEHDYVTFGSCNNLAKVTPEVVTVWASILRSIPASRLLIKAKPLADQETRNRYLQLFAENGVAAERLTLHGWLPAQKDHLELYRQIDVGLDPFPYNGTTTTCEAMWMGVPVITLCGDRHAARVGASIMHQVGLLELIAHTEQEYTDLAVSLAQDHQRLYDLRRNLRQRMQDSPLMDKTLFAGSVENAYLQMWRKWCTA